MADVQYVVGNIRILDKSVIGIFFFFFLLKLTMRLSAGHFMASSELDVGYTVNPSRSGTDGCCPIHNAISVLRCNVTHYGKKYEYITL